MTNSNIVTSSLNDNKYTIPPPYPHLLNKEIYMAYPLIEGDENFEEEQYVDYDDNDIPNSILCKKDRLIYIGNYNCELHITLHDINSKEYSYIQNVNKSKLKSIKSILFTESRQEYLNEFILDIDLYENMKKNYNKDNRICLCSNIKENGWCLIQPDGQWGHYMKDDAYVCVRERTDGLEFYIYDTGEYGPYRIPIRLIDDLIEKTN